MKKFTNGCIKEIENIVIENIAKNSDKLKGKHIINLPYDKICNMIITFDTETSLINVNGQWFDKSDEKNKIVAYNYIQMINIDGHVYYTRYLKDMAIIFDVLENTAKNNKCNLIVYVHNLGFDFEFIRQYLNCITFKNNRSRHFDVFARTAHKPMKIEWGNITFKCSYVLSNMSLEMCAKVENLAVKKQVGKLDYNKIRHSETILTDDELLYCEYDVIVLYEYIKKKITEEKGHLRKIPLTATSYVRRALLSEYGKKRALVHKRTELKQENFEVFKLLRQAYTGGYCYGNPVNSRKICENVTSLDFTSSYPAVCLRKKFPVGVFKKSDGTQREMKTLIKTDGVASVFHIIFQGVKSKTPICTLSKSKCNIHSLSYYDNTALECKNKEMWKYSECNGKISRCWIVDTVFTDVDLKIFDLYYTYEKYCICELYTTHYGYLDDCFRLSILKAYKTKTELKGLTDTAENLTKYNNSKAFINSLYGCCCFNIMNDKVVFDETTENVWNTAKKSIDDYKEYYEKDTTILPYQYGVWITAWARYELLTSIAYIKPRHFIYSDTDSIKLMCYDDVQIDKKGNNFTYRERIEKINNRIVAETLQAFENSDIDLNTYPINPLDKKGNSHYIGIFTYEGQCRYFKTLGAKRYLNTEFKNNLSESDIIDKFFITCAGVDKNKTSDYFTQKYSDTKNLQETFDIFDDDMQLNAEICGRNVHYYTKIEMSDYDNPEYTYEIIDYTGKKSTAILSDCVAITKSVFTLTMEEMHLDYICNWHTIAAHTDCELGNVFNL